ncbi:hypothetical protein [Saccharopolyspora shandongensis]|uniref:hypothetical protein n=1 Tax=Saccharopolyspora shandongensis TaxID=418495 RepID=UPI0033F9B1E3
MTTADVPFSMYPRTTAVPMRDLLRRCEITHDHAERAALLERLADELDRATRDLLAGRPAEECDRRELAASLRGQAGMVRFFADLERRDRARQAFDSARPRVR